MSHTRLPLNAFKDGRAILIRAGRTFAWKLVRNSFSYGGSRYHCDFTILRRYRPTIFIGVGGGTVYPWQSMHSNNPVKFRFRSGTNSDHTRTLGRMYRDRAILEESVSQLGRSHGPTHILLNIACIDWDSVLAVCDSLGRPPRGNEPPESHTKAPIELIPVSALSRSRA